MHKLIVTKKTGFRIRDVNVPVVIRDFRGILFYSTEDIMPRAKEFNLPMLDSPSIYLVESGMFAELSEPVKYNEIPLPPFERTFSDPSKFEIVFEKVKEKAKVSWFKEKIYFDESFREKPLPVLYYTLYHEYAHRYFKTEKYVELLAFNYMIRKGFTPNQTAKAPINSLSAAQDYRKWFLIEKIIETNGNKLS